MTKISMAEYAKHRGVSKPAVTKAVQVGRIKLHTDADGSRYLILEDADRDWSHNTQIATHPTGVAKKPAEEKPKPERVEKPAAPAAAAAPDSSREQSIPSITQSKAIKEAFLARSAKLDYDERLGTLISAAEAQKEYFGIMRTLRDHLLNIPDRIAAELAAETNQFVVHKKLSEELKRALSTMKGANE
jgi:hypothetical protein